MNNTYKQPTNKQTTKRYIFYKKSIILYLKGSMLTALLYCQVSQGEPAAVVRVEQTFRSPTNSWNRRDV